MKFLLAALSLTLLVLATAEPYYPLGGSCPDFCTDLWNPICAVSQTCTALFGNPCKFDAWNCKAAPAQRFYVANNLKCSRLDRYNSIVCR